MDAIYIESVHPDARVDDAALTDLVRRVATGEGCAIAMLGIILADHATVLDLNRSYLDHDYHTDVLAFNLSDAEGVIEGEIYVDLDTAQERHAEFGASFEEEVHRYVVHGLLHLIGYDDATPPEKAAMHALEDRYLREAKGL